MMSTAIVDVFHDGDSVSYGDVVRAVQMASAGADLNYEGASGTPKERNPATT